MPSLAIGLIWSVLGLILGIPYFYLVSAPEYFLVHCFLLVPVMTTFGAFLYLFEYVRTHSRKPSRPFCLYVLWGVSPIILNLLSILTKAWISEAAGELIFKYRFVPLWTPIVLIFLAIALAPILLSNKKNDECTEAENSREEQT